MDNRKATIAQLVAQVLTEAADLPPQEQETLVHQKCGHDQELKAVVDYLLGASSVGIATESADAPVNNGGPETAALLLNENSLRQIGRYKILQPLGEGGFGAVFMAEQEYPIRRTVALKIIKPGMDTRQVIARFEAERQALAMMDHPNIAKVFDAGSTDAGRPYFVMELVRGIPITEYCDKHNLNLRERLELFLPACQAVQHAHQKGIIHRDIKPANVLVTLHDGRPIPKVIDFGIAKATQTRLTDKTLITEFRQLMGTPEYMSPEQAEMSSLDVDTRADVYSLGVLLYELLTGTTPLEAEELRAKPYAQIERIIREVDPPRPSTRIGSLGERLGDTAARRGSDPKRLGGLVRGELDWIVMRCLEKDRTRRYETADALALDVRNHLEGKPVLACPPSAVYLFRKFAAHNKRSLVLACLLLLMLIATTIVAVASGIQQKGLADDRSRFIEQRDRSIADLQQRQRQTDAQLYNALVEESAALRIARKPGYRNAVFENLHRAARLDTSKKNLQQIATEALACLGDPLGLEAPALPAAPETIEPHLRQGDLGLKTVSADGTWTAILTSDGRLTLRQRGRVAPMGFFDLPLGVLLDMQFSPKGDFLALGCEEGAILLTVPELARHSFYRGYKAVSVAFHPSGHLFAFTGRTISLCSPRSSRLISSLVADPAINLVTFSKDRQLLLGLNSQQPNQVLQAWSIGNTPECLNLDGHDGGVTQIAYSPDGSELASAGADRVVKIWNSSDGTWLRTCSANQTPVRALAYHPAGNLLASAEDGGTIVLWDPRTARQLHQFKTSTDGRPLRIQFDSGGNYLAVCSGGRFRGGLEVFAISQTKDGPSAESFLKLSRGGIVTDLAVHPAGRQLAFVETQSRAGPQAVAGNQRGFGAALIHGYDFDEMRWALLINTPVWPQRFGLHFDPEGNTLRFTTPRYDSVAVNWPLGSPAGKWGDVVAASITSLSPDGRWLATIVDKRRIENVVEEKHVTIYDLRSQIPWCTLPMGQDEAATLAFSPDGTRLGIGYDNGALVIWKLEAVRSILHEFGVEVPSTAAIPSPNRPKPLTSAAFAEILNTHREAAKNSSTPQ